YTTAADNTAPRKFTTTVSDGTSLATATSVVRITPVNDRPTLGASAVVAAVAAGRPVVLTHAMLLEATGAGDVDGDAVKFRIESVQAGRLERWTGY
ncbi:MAG: hypothetical protein ACKOTB_17625, partial [Planctomycetia bacterium]